MAERPVLPGKAVDGDFAGDRETHSVVVCTSSAAQVTRRTVQLDMISMAFAVGAVLAAAQGHFDGLRADSMSQQVNDSWRSRDKASSDGSPLLLPTRGRRWDEELPPPTTQPPLPPPTPPRATAAVAAAAAVATLTDALEDQHSCFDCDVPCADDRWCSTTYGVIICINCAGDHRSLGVHRSFVRSLTLDALKEEEARCLVVGGNSRFKRWLAEMGVPRHAWLALPLELRYHTPAADLYRRRLLAELAGEPPPTDLQRVKLPPPPKQKAATRWTPDDEAPRCQLCKADFGPFVWRHHCRRCGRCICYQCSPPTSFVPLPDAGDDAEPVRQCKLCVPPPARLMIGM